MQGSDRVTFRPQQFDWPLFLGIVAIASIGVVNLYSATSPYSEADTRRAGLADVYATQVYWLAVGALVAIAITWIDYRHFERLAYFLFASGIVGLLLVFVFGPDIRNARRWIQIGGFQFQPSEFMKILLVLAIAKYLHDDARTEPRSLVDLALPAALTAAPAALVVIQPDLGTAILYLLTVGSMLAMTKIRTWSLVGLGALFAGGGVLFWLYGMRDYQKLRVTSFFDPQADLTDAGWHALQSRTAIGNGSVLGEGYMQGTLNQSGFLPDQFSDFPFAVFAEDWGFAGSVVLLALYAFVCIWALHVASQSRDRFGAAVAVGIGAMFFWQTVANLGMAMGLLPVVGITLPMLSYGGSSVVTTLAALGLLMNVSVRR
jgi:rod shape determining protein RodA